MKAFAIVVDISRNRLEVQGEAESPRIKLNKRIEGDETLPKVLYARCASEIT
jgi:hypothetical protein